MVAELAEVSRTEVGKLVSLPIAPDVLDGIQFGSVGRQVLERETPVLVRHEVPDQSAAVLAQSVPDHQEVAWNLTQQTTKEIHNLWTPDRTGIQPEVKRPPGHTGDRGQGLPVEVILQDRGLASRRPRAATMRLQAQSAFVDEDDRLAFASGVFFRAGQWVFFHQRIASSLRSSARPVGRWQVQPSCRRMRHTWLGWYRTPHSISINSATRPDVQSPFSKPKASAPRCSPRSTRRRSGAARRGGRPIFFALRRDRRPPSSSCCAQRLTDWRWTPTSRATSDWLRPLRNRSTAFIRRFSSASKSRRTPAGFPIAASIDGTERIVTMLCNPQ